MKFKNIIGVIKDAINAHVWGVSRMMEALGGKEITLEELQRNWEQPYMNFWKKYYPNLTLQEEQKLYYSTILRKDCPKSVDYPGIADLIKELKIKGISMVVLSSDAPETLLPEMKEYDLENIFREVITKVHDKADSIEGLISQNNFKKEETVFIGDSNHEVEVGKRAGIKTIAVTWGFCTEEKLKSTHPDYLVHNIKELKDILL